MNPQTYGDPPRPSVAGPVLLVEEDLKRRERLYDLLTRHGYPVVAVHSGERAVEVLKHEHAVLIVAAAELSDTTGWALAQRIRAFDTRVPILLLARTHQTPPGVLGASTVQATLYQDLPDPAFLSEVARWIKPAPPVHSERWPGTVLVVDDEPKMRALLTEFLQSHGFSVATAASGEEALARLEQAPPTIVLLDFKMPGMDGLLALKKVKAMRATVSVILITGLQDEVVMQEALALGADDYILKPFNLDYLESVLLTKILTGQSSP